MRTHKETNMVAGLYPGLSRVEKCDDDYDSVHSDFSTTFNVVVVVSDKLVKSAQLLAAAVINSNVECHSTGNVVEQLHLFPYISVKSILAHHKTKI